MCCGTEAGSYLRLIDSCITQLKVQGPSRTCNESKEEEEDGRRSGDRAHRKLAGTHRILALSSSSLLLSSLELSDCSVSVYLGSPVW